MAITVYGTPRCTQCKRTCDLLDSLDIDYEYVDLSLSPSAMQMIKQHEGNFKEAPVVITDTDYWSGFRADKIQEFTSQLAA